MADNRYIRNKNGKFMGSRPADPKLNLLPKNLPPIPKELMNSILSPEASKKYDMDMQKFVDPNRKAEYFEKENSVLNLFEKGSVVTFGGRDFEVKVADKPFAQKGGEPKTDVYIILEDRMSGEKEEIKISYKSENYQFLENKMDKNRFEAIFTPDEQSLIHSLLPLNKKVNQKVEIDEKDLLNEETKMTLGYRLDLMASDASGYMPIAVSEATMEEILSGAKLDDSKRNGTIHGEVVENSGAANFVLVGDKFNSAEEALAAMVPIKKYVKDSSKRIIGLAPKAVNLIPHRAKDFGGDKPKPWDGNRPLVISLEWTRRNGKFIGKPKSGAPLFEKWATPAGISLLDAVKKVLSEG